MADETDAELALEAVVAAARAHLAALRTRTGPDDERVQLAFEALNDASAAYDDVLLDVFDDVTPWECGTDLAHAVDLDDDEDAPDPEYVSVRARYDFAVVDLDGLLAAGTAARRADYAEAAPCTGAGEAVYELLHAAGPMLPALDLPVLERGGGFALVHSCAHPLAERGIEIDADYAGLLPPDDDDRLLFTVAEI